MKVYFYLPVFSIVLKHVNGVPYPSGHSRIVRISHEFQSLYHFRFWSSPGNFWTMGRLGEWVWNRYVLSASLYFEWTFSLSLWSSVISNLTNCYFLGYWTASLKRNTEWTGQETTSRGKVYNNLVTFGSTYFIYPQRALRSLNLSRELK